MISKSRKTFFHIAAIAIIGCSVYINSLNGQFLWDDDYLIKNNVFVRNWSYLPKIFSQDMGAGAGIRYSFYRPLTIFTYVLDYSLWRLKPIGYHITNVFFHIAAALSIYWLVTLLFNNRNTSILSAVFFAIHPVHAEAVAYISGRTDLMSALFIFLAFIFYIKYLHSEKTYLYIIMLLCYILAVLSKENGVIFPILALLYHYTFSKKIKLKEFLILALITLAYIILRLTVLASLSFCLPNLRALLERIPGFFVALLTYLKVFILPFDLHAEYGQRLFSFSDPKTISGIIIFFPLLYYSFTKRRYDKLIFFSIWWFFITLLPVSNLIRSTFFMAEHWLYLPSLGFFMILANIFTSLYGLEKMKKIAITAAMALLVFYLYLTIIQNTYWKEPLTFYERTLKYAPYSSQMYINLGVTYASLGKKEKALSLYNKAIEINPNFAEAYLNIGNLYATSNQEKAIESYRKAVHINPNFAQAYNNLGTVYRNTARYEEAALSYKKAVEIYPYFVNAYINLGNLYLSLGDKEKSLEILRKAAEIDPRCAEAYYYLGVTYRAMGRKGEAVRFFTKAIELNPDYANITQ